MSENKPSTSTSHEDHTELEKLIRSFGPWFEENGTTLIYAVAALLTITAVAVYMNRTPAADYEASRSLLLATSPEDFGDVADSNPESKIGVVSRLRQGERLLSLGVTNMFKDRENGMEELDRAEAAFDQVESRNDLDDDIRERLLICRANLAEARCDGSAEKTEAAIAAWQRLLDSFPDSVIKDHAEQRIQRLGTGESEAFYTWFGKLDPKPAFPGLDGAGGTVPAVPSNVDGAAGGEPEASSEKTEATEAEPTEAEPTEAESTDAEPTDAESTDAESTESGDSATEADQGGDK